MVVFPFGQCSLIIPSLFRLVLTASNYAGILQYYLSQIQTIQDVKVSRVCGKAANFVTDNLHSKKNSMNREFEPV